MKSLLVVLALLAAGPCMAEEWASPDTDVVLSTSENTGGLVIMDPSYRMGIVCKPVDYQDTATGIVATFDCSDQKRHTVSLDYDRNQITYEGHVFESKS